MILHHTTVNIFSRDSFVVSQLSINHNMSCQPELNKESVSMIVDTLFKYLNINYFLTGTAGLAGVFAASGFSPKFGATTPGSACFAC